MNQLPQPKDRPGCATSTDTARMRHLDGYDVAPIEFDVAPDTDSSGAGLVIR
ncbi:hypothetical protein [Frankia sp. CcI49]|uniref:hypothetical protein n=1 Tax=Frankia sp. CcI49 TaxID=1745382 RepID=UPI0013047AAB|nr:hypothetical protein [Frankia sp. CcI49]